MLLISHQLITVKHLQELKDASKHLSFHEGQPDRIIPDGGAGSELPPNQSFHHRILQQSTRTFWTSPERRSTKEDETVALSAPPS